MAEVLTEMAEALPKTVEVSARIMAEVLPEMAEALPKMAED